jgi:hypothetical protein
LILCAMYASPERSREVYGCHGRSETRDLEEGCIEYWRLTIIVKILKRIRRYVLAVLVVVYRVQCSSFEVVEDGRAGFLQISAPLI